MKRIHYLLMGGGAVAATYLLVALGAPDPSLGPVTIARIALPGLVSGLVLTLYIASEARSSKANKEKQDELSAQLVRKEIEIGRLSTMDELTGLYTRREFELMIRQEFERSRRYGRSLSLLLLELDDVTATGGKSGKLSKGYLISEVSAVLRGMLRTNDLACRFTAEIMALLLPETNEEQAVVVAGRVAARIDQHEALGAVGLQLTAAQGIATLTALMQTHEEFQQAAEEALSDARIAGCGEVRTYKPKVSYTEGTQGSFRLAG